MNIEHLTKIIDLGFFWVFLAILFVGVGVFLVAGHLKDISKKMK